MSEEGKISMSQFKTVVEGFEDKLQRVAEGVLQLNEKVDVEFRSVKEQIALLHVGQTGIRTDIRETHNELHDMNQRVTRLEERTA